MSAKSLPLPGSVPLHPAGARVDRTPGGTKQIRVTVVLRKDCTDGNANTRVVDFAQRHRLKVVRVCPGGNDVVLLGTRAAVERAFGVELRLYRHDDSEYIGHTGPILLAPELRGAVEAVLGLDESPVQALGVPAWELCPSAMWPGDVAALYGFPDDATGAGQRIAILSFGGGYHAGDITAYFGGLLKSEAPAIKPISVLKARNKPCKKALLKEIIELMNTGEAELSRLIEQYGQSAYLDAVHTVETTADLQVCGAIAPGASLELYLAPNTSQGYYEALYQALSDPPAAITISWGGSERTLWNENKIRGVNAILQTAKDVGVTVCCSSGDFGSRGTEPGTRPASVSFPGSSPLALACGGTTIEAEGGVLKGEVAWKASFLGIDMASGGGISGIFPRPDYQAGAGVPTHADVSPTPWVNDENAEDDGFVGRGVPDVAAHASYRIVVGGAKTVAVGTSMAAPVWAALIALLTEKRGQPVGWLNERIYGGAFRGACRDVERGDNAVAGSDVASFHCGVGWDACCGLGTPDGRLLLRALNADTANVSPSAGRVRAQARKTLHRPAADRMPDAP